MTAKRHETDKSWMTQTIKNLIGDRQAAFMQGNTAEWKILRNKIKRLIEQAKTKSYADRVRYLQKTDSKNWHRQVELMTRNSSTDVCIQVRDVQAYKHNEIANAINCKFVNVSASMAPLDYSNLPAFLPAVTPIWLESEILSDLILEPMRHK